jgi:DNA-binding response OmpR family regulator
MAAFLHENNMTKILVLDDDHDILSLVETILSMNKFSVKAISNWEEIYSNMAEFEPDLILLDVMLNGADGRDICKKIHSDEETGNIPVVLFSANPEMGKYTKDCMAQDFVAKPFSISGLLNTIKTHIN